MPAAFDPTATTGDNPAANAATAQAASSPPTGRLFDPTATAGDNPAGGAAPVIAAGGAAIAALLEQTRVKVGAGI